MKICLSVVLGLSLVFAPTAGSTLEPPAHYPKNVPIPSDDGIHHKITGRSMTSLLRLYDRGTITTMGGLVIDPFQQLLSAMDGAVQGNTSLLSLGEGRSSFVYQLLGERKYFLTLSQESADAIDNIHAVDLSYPRYDGRSVIDPRRPDPGNVAGLDRYDLRMLPVIQQYPSNYHSQLFQHLDIRNSSGEPMRFSTIVSTFALSYVLLADTPPEQVQPVVERILTHLAPGGMILMTPVPQVGAPADLMDRIVAYNGIMEDLRSRGEISDFNWIMGDFRQKQTPLVVIK